MCPHWRDVFKLLCAKGFLKGNGIYCVHALTPAEGPLELAQRGLCTFLHDRILFSFITEARDKVVKCGYAPPCSLEGQIHAKNLE